MQSHYGEWERSVEVNASHFRRRSDCFPVFVTGAPHPPGCHSVQPKTLKLLHQVPAKNVPSSFFVWEKVSSFVWYCRKWRFSSAAVVQVVVGMTGGWDAALLQQLQESQWWSAKLCGGCLASLAKVLLQGWWSAHVLTVPRRWQAERVKAIKKKETNKILKPNDITSPLQAHACSYKPTGEKKTMWHVLVSLAHQH